MSDWRLFRDSPETLTTGRYYFSRPGTPHVPGLHHYGSKTWHDGNWETVQKLGENLTTVSEWDNGALPGRMPKNAIVGNTDCIAYGELIEDGESAELVEGGFIDACYTPIGLDERYAIVSDYKNCKIQKWYAELLHLSYSNQSALQATRIASLIGTIGLTVTHHPETNLLPAVTTVIHATWTLVIVDGSRTAQQIALQGFQSIMSPTKFGVIGTSPVWYRTSSYIHKLLTNDGATPSVPIMMVGHSYGGASLQVLAARYRRAATTRTIRFLNFGIPKPGDSKLATLISECEGLNIQNDSDLVAIFPPDQVTLFPVMNALGVPTLAVWHNWRAAPHSARQLSSGKLLHNNPGQCDFATLYTWASNAIANLAQPFLTVHTIGAYWERISKRCPVPPIVLPPIAPCATPVAIEPGKDYEGVFSGMLNGDSVPVYWIPAYWDHNEIHSMSLTIELINNPPLFYVVFGPYVGCSRLWYLGTHFIFESGTYSLPKNFLQLFPLMAITASDSGVPIDVQVKFRINVYFG